MLPGVVPVAACSTPETRVEGIGPTAVCCVKCGAEAPPFTFANGYTIAFDESRSVGLTLHQEAAEEIARDAKNYAALPSNSVQNCNSHFRPARPGWARGSVTTLHGSVRDRAGDLYARVA
jgi:hypothetical protein